jgi:hypothetical protein
MPTADSPEALAAAIARLTDEGASVAEVSKATGLSEQRIRRLASRHRVKLQPPGPARRLAVNLSRQRLVILRDLAASAQISPTQMLTRIAACALADGTERTRRWLGREGLPARPRKPARGHRTAFRAEEAVLVAGTDFGRSRGHSGLSTGLRTSKDVHSPKAGSPARQRREIALPRNGSPANAGDRVRRRCIPACSLATQPKTNNPRAIRRTSAPAGERGRIAHEPRLMDLFS